VFRQANFNKFVVGVSLKEKISTIVHFISKVETKIMGCDRVMHKWFTEKWRGGDIPQNG
jgi:hypothetical protein